MCILYSTQFVTVKGWFSRIYTAGGAPAHPYSTPIATDSRLYIEYTHIYIHTLHPLYYLYIYMLIGFIHTIKSSRPDEPCSTQLLIHIYIYIGIYYTNKLIPHRCRPAARRLEWKTTATAPRTAQRF